MSSLPDPGSTHIPPPLLPYAQPFIHRPVRPTSVTVLSIVGIVIGSLGALGILMQVAQLLGLRIDGGNPAAQALVNDPALHRFTIISNAIGAILLTILLIGAIRSLSLKPIGRKYLLAYAWILVVQTPISLVVSVVWMLPKMSEAIANSSLLAQMKPIMQMSIWVGGFAGLLGLIYPGFIIYYMTRPHVKEAFQRGMALPGTTRLEQSPDFR